MDILVTGGTGFVGSRLCAELADRGHDVTALSRTPDDGHLSESVARTVGDVTAFESIVDAFAGVEAVVNLVSLSPLFKPSGGDAMHRRVHVDGTRNVVRAAERNGVRKVVQMSGLGADPDAPTAFLRAKGDAERIVREADLARTIFRPSVVFGDGAEFVPFTKLLTTPYVAGLPSGGSTRFQPIWIEDVVPMLADCVEPAHDGETYEIGGPEVLTLADVTRLVYRASGTPVRIVPVPMPLAHLGLALADPLPFVPLGMDQYRALGVDNTVTHNDVDAFGVETSDLRTFADYLGLSGQKL